MREKLVAHLTDGEVLKGFSVDFSPKKSHFHLMTPGGEVSSSRRVEMDELKALFFVRTWGRARGQTERRYRFGVGGMGKEPGRRAVIRFHDGERVWGYVLESPPLDPGLYLVPADPQDNNLKIYAVTAALEELLYLGSADEVSH